MAVLEPDREPAARREVEAPAALATPAVGLLPAAAVQPDHGGAKLVEVGGRVEAVETT